MTTLAQYERARAALAEATRIDQVLPILDEVEHVKLYARQIEDRALLADATEFQLKAERRLGVVITEAKRAGHFAEGRRPKPENGSRSEPFVPATLAEAGITKKLSSKAQRASSLSERAFDALVEQTRERIAAGTAIVVDPVRASQHEQEIAERRAAHAARTFDGGKVEDLRALAASGFRAKAILADPAWHFVARSDNGEGRSASAHYTTDRRWRDIIELPVKQLAADDCTLFMWMVDWCPRLALDVVEAWGFTHKTTAFTWAKQNESGEGWHMGQGYWTRANPEDCWLATRGAPKRMNADVRQLVVAPVMEHSEKPHEIHDRIMRLVEGPYLELYARRERAGWLTWGNEIPFNPAGLRASQSQSAPIAPDIPDNSEAA